MSGIFNLDFGSIISGVRGVIDDVHTSDEERMGMELQAKQLDAQLLTGQMEINQAEAGHKSIFVAGWRPAIGWIGALALGYKFIFHPLLLWIWFMAKSQGWIPEGVGEPPIIDAGELYPIIMGMLGLGTMRTVEGIKGVKTQSINQPEKKPWYKRVFSK